MRTAFLAAAVVLCPVAAFSFSSFAQHFLDEAVSALAAGDAEKARARAAEATARDDTLRDALEIQAAYWLAAGLEDAHAELWTALARLPAPARTPEPPPVGAAPPARVTRYVSATSTRVRARPDVKSRVEAELPLNTQVTVNRVQGDWAAISSHVPAAVTLAFDGPPPVLQDVETQGYVQWRYLVSQPLSRVALVEDAAQEEQRGNNLEAARRLERAMLLDPHDVMLRRKVAAMATAARLWDLAMRAAFPLTGADVQPGLEPWATRLPAALFYACSGRREVMSAVFAGGLNVKKAASEVANACLVNMDARGPCAPGDCEPPACDVEKARKKYAAYKRQIDAAFATAPYARFVVAGSDDDRAADRSLFAWSVSFVTRGCPNSAIEYQATDVSVSTTGVPARPAGTLTTVWAMVPAYQDHVHGLVAAHNGLEAQRMVQAVVSRPDYQPRRHGPFPVVVGPASVCACGSTAPRAAPEATPALLGVIERPRELAADAFHDFLGPDERVYVVTSSNEDVAYVIVDGRALRLKMVDASPRIPTYLEVKTGDRYWRVFDGDGVRLRLEYTAATVQLLHDCVRSDFEAVARLTRGKASRTVKLRNGRGC